MNDKTITVIGLGYVGLPLAVEFGKKRKVIGFDIDPLRIKELEGGVDRTLEVLEQELKDANGLSFSSDVEDLKACQIFIITVPTPVDHDKKPDLTALKSVTKMIGNVMSEGALVIYESTVYPGCTTEVCVPILEETSGLKYNKSFFVGYSPERANPGDRNHRLTTIMKVTAGSTEEIANEVDALYAAIVPAGTHKASSIEVAEAAKVIENTQRDLNIALMNELSVIFNRLNIDTIEVLEAAGTKWNFLPFRPGLVGGHCIGVDPYYLTHKAQLAGYEPEVILAGRRINDGMAHFVADQVTHLMLQKSIVVKDSKILVMGVSFKENCPDIRNSKVFDLISRLQETNAQIDVYDPWVDSEQVQNEYGVTCLTTEPETGTYDSVVLTVGHKEFLELGIEKVKSYCKETSVFYDVKGLFPKHLTDGRL